MHRGAVWTYSVKNKYSNRFGMNYARHSENKLHFLYCILCQTQSQKKVLVTIISYEDKIDANSFIKVRNSSLAHQKLKSRAQKELFHDWQLFLLGLDMCISTTSWNVFVYIQGSTLAHCGCSYYTLILIVPLKFNNQEGIIWIARWTV